ncbi:hypothetical protein IJ541_03110 [bacterium]|nr:hypothetical protein [bacterium]
MIDSNNILLITDSEDVAKNVTEKLVLLRNNDSITVSEVKNYKKTLENSLYCVVLLHEDEDSNVTLKIINNIKEIKPDAEIILLLNDSNPQLILNAYDCGIYDYFLTDAEDYEMLIKTINCFRLRLVKDICSRNEKFLYQQGVIDSKTGLYQYKHLKEIFIDISDNLRIQNGAFAIITLDEKTKTKISTNRLSQAIKTSVRGDDIIAVARGGKFYLVLPNIDLIGTKNLIQKIQNKMGEDFLIRAGLSKIGIQSFETLDKNAQDGLTSAIQNEVMAVCLEDNIDVQNSWLEDDETENNNRKKNFKLFKMAFTNKMNNIITPLFFRYQKEFETKLTNTTVSQYANNIECVFCLKNEKQKSELTIRYNGYAKFNIEITHSGLDSAENTKIEIPLSSMTEKFLSAQLKRLKNEYKQSAY